MCDIQTLQFSLLFAKNFTKLQIREGFSPANLLQSLGCPNPRDPRKQAVARTARQSRRPQSHLNCEHRVRAPKASRPQSLSNLKGFESASFRVARHSRTLKHEHS